MTPRMYLALLAGSSITVACGAPTSTTATATQVIVYEPLGLRAAPAADIVVASTASGNCQGSLASTRPDALRCFVGHGILDPCFLPPAPDTSVAACPSGVPPGKVELVTLTQPPPSSAASSPPSVWGIVLVNGAHCQIDTGATTTVAGQRLNYDCDDGEALFGEPDRAPAVWTILGSKDLRSSTLTAVSIAIAYE
jgi:hypothetical protein